MSEVFGRDLIEKHHLTKKLSRVDVSGSLPSVDELWF